MDAPFIGLGLRIWVLPDEFAATADFYGDALGLTCAWRDDASRVATYELGFGPTVVIEGFEPRAGRERLFGRETGISLEVADIQAAYTILSARGVAFEAPPAPQPWGAVMAFFQDPAGNSHTLLERPGKGAANG